MRILWAFVLLFAVGLITLGYSLSLPGRVDEAIFKTAYAELKQAHRAEAQARTVNDPDTHVWEYRYDKAYEELSRSHPKLPNPVRDYGIMAVVVGISGMTLFARGLRGLRTPARRTTIIGVGLLAVILSFLTEWHRFTPVMDLPQWRQSIGCGLPYIVLIFWGLILTVWVMLHWLFLYKYKSIAAVRIFPLLPTRANLFLIGELALTLLITSYVAVQTLDYRTLIATPLWLYFYLSLIAVQKRAAPPEPKSA